jgi:hypothetical protein
MKLMFSFFGHFKKLKKTGYLHQYIQILPYNNCNVVFVLCLHALNVNIALIFDCKFPQKYEFETYCNVVIKEI